MKAPNFSALLAQGPLFLLALADGVLSGLSARVSPICRWVSDYLCYKHSYTGAEEYTHALRAGVSTLPAYAAYVSPSAHAALVYSTHGSPGVIDPSRAFTRVPQPRNSCGFTRAPTPPPGDAQRTRGVYLRSPQA
jgi:hypothetical protein